MPVAFVLGLIQAEYIPIRAASITGNPGNARAALAVDMFNYGVKKLIGAYAAAMGGVDAIVFTGGIGENVAHIRKAAVEGLEYMGVVLDEEKNNAARPDCFIEAADSKTRLMVIETNEELAIARDTLELCGK